MENGQKKPFKFEVGQLVLQRLPGGWVEVQIIERTVINGHNVYRTDMRSKWDNEDNF